MKVTIFTTLTLLSTLTSARAFGPNGSLSSRQATNNLQTFEGAVGAAALPITKSGDQDRPFQVNGETFQSLNDAATRACDVQFNSCANVANSEDAIEFANCVSQKDDCLASIQDGLEARKAALSGIAARTNATAAAFKRSNVGARSVNETAPATNRFTARGLSQDSNSTVARGLHSRSSNSTIAARGLLSANDEPEAKRSAAVRSLNETVTRDVETFPSRRGRMIRRSL